MGKKFTVLEAKERLELAKKIIEEIKEAMKNVEDDLYSAVKMGEYEIEDEEAGRNKGSLFKSNFISGVIYESGLNKSRDELNYYLDEFFKLIEEK